MHAFENTRIIEILTAAMERQLKENPEDKTKIPLEMQATAIFMFRLILLRTFGPHGFDAIEEDYKMLCIALAGDLIRNHPDIMKNTQNILIRDLQDIHNER